MTDKKETVPYAPYFADGDGYAGVEWRNDFVAEVREADGTVVFRQEGVEAPSFWSARAVNTVGSKYFRGAVDTPERENSVRQIIDRVVNKTVEWGVADGYFDEDAGEAFGEDLRWLLVHQYGSFNSPVWFNLGVNERPQCAACFLLSVKDTMEGIMDLAKTEALIFRDGSGCGTNLSTLRSTADVLSGGGKPSGPVSFMRIYDTAAGVIRSGGKSRRSAKMNMLNSDHPDIMEFIRCKAHEELKAYALERAGYSGGLDGEAAMSVFFQNINISVRASDAFMEAVENDGDWPLRLVKDHEKVVETVKARSIMRAIAEGTHQCGDPGMMFDDTINGWNPVLNTERINTCNPCAEVHFVDDSACNLASLNLLKFLKEDGTFDVDAFQHAVAVFFIAQDIFVDRAAYPTEAVAQNSYKHRPLGLGYANLGALLMAKGLPYDSDGGRSYAAAVTDLMQATAYNTSVELARCLGPCASFEPNRGSFGAVLEKHLAAHEKLSGVLKDGAIWAAAEDQWAAASVRAATQSGVRNMQMSLLAPTGTISFMMDCDTTGCEPDMALVKIKALAGGGEIRMVNQTVPLALQELSYDQDTSTAILEFVEKNGTIEGAPGVKDEHLPVFDCAFRPVKGKRFISHHGHIKMLAAIQPFLSGAISKCVTGDTMVTTSNGLVRIKDFYQGEVSDSFRDIELEVSSLAGVPSKAKSFYYGGEKSVFKVVLGDGRIVRGTDQHRVRVATPGGLDWKRLPELSVGDFVALSFGADMWGTETEVNISGIDPLYGGQKKLKVPTTFNSELAMLLGMLTADGHVSRGVWTVKLFKNCPEVLERFTSIIEDNFGVTTVEKVDSRTGVHERYLASKTFVQWLDCVGWCKEHVPDVILKGPREHALAYLSGLYLDGFISNNAPRIGQKRGSLLRDVQFLWDNLGVGTYFTDNYVGGVNYPVLNTSSWCVEQAAAMLEWLEPHKQERAAAVRPGQDIRVFPMYRELIQTCIREKGVTQQYRSIMDRRTANIRVSTAKQAVEELKIHLPEEVFSYVYVPVVEVEEDGVEEVYDLSVPGTEAFVANGVVNHNTVNTPEETTVEEIEQIYIDAWKLGLKAVAIYRNNSKQVQPVTLVGDDDKGKAKKDLTGPPPPPERHRLRDTRESITHKFIIGEHEGYFTVGLYPNGRPGELFVRIAKEGSLISGLMDTFATALSIMLQYGVSLEMLIRKFSFVRFEPSGFTGDRRIGGAKSIVDYIFRWMDHEFCDGRITSPPRNGSSAEPQVPGYRSARGDDTELLTVEKMAQAAKTLESARRNPECIDGIAEAVDTKPCPCGEMMIRSGKCYLCLWCGTSEGCS